MKNIKTNNRKIILFVPGYYGTTLVEKKSSKVRWAHIFDFFFSQKGITTTIPGTNIIASEELVPTEVLQHVTLIPYLKKIDSYGKTLAMLEEFASQHQMTVETAPYDWREDFISSLKLIDKKIKSLSLTPDDELYVVSHSTGSLLMAYYLRYGAQGINRELLSARDYSSFKSSYMFLPPKGEDVGYNSDNHKEMPLNLHDAETWVKNKWGVFKFIGDSEKEAAKNFIDTYMSRSQKFHDLLRAPIKNNPDKKLPLLYTWGTGHKTVQKGFVSERKNGGAGKEVDFTLKESQVDGDGTVTFDSGRPLNYFKSLDLILQATKFSHLDVVASKENQKVIQEFILKK